MYLFVKSNCLAGSCHKAREKQNHSCMRKDVSSVGLARKRAWLLVSTRLQVIAMTIC